MKAKELIIVAAIGAAMGLGIGLLIKKRKPSEKQIVNDVFASLKFGVSNATILGESLPFLDQLAELLITQPSYRLSLVGHTDSSGSEAKNITLSQARANAVKNYLVSKKVDASRIDAKGIGSVEPIAENTTPEGKEKNRRVDFNLIK